MGSESKRHNIFISHHHRDEEKIPVLKRLLRMKGNEVSDSSIDSTKPNRATSPEYIKTLIRPKIDWAGKVIVMIGHDTHSRKWVDWEIKYAEKQGKQIIGMYIDGCDDADLPPSFEDCADHLIDWDGDKLNRALRGEDVPWCYPNGVERPPIDGSRSTCR